MTPALAADGGVQPGAHGRPWAPTRPQDGTQDAGVDVLQGDALDLLARVPEASVDVVFADPPYFLSGGGTTCRAGRRVSVDKGTWDQARSFDDVHRWNLAWLTACRRLLRPSGSLWVCGTSHNTHSVGFALQALGYRVLNEVTWEKPNPPPNLGRRCLTHSTETLIWASHGARAPHYFDYAEARRRGGGRQLKTVWRCLPPGPAEKRCGPHPTQKPLGLVTQALAISAPAAGLVLDPFAGSGTTLLAARSLGMRALGFELDPEFVALARRRLAEHPQAPMSAHGPPERS